MAEKVEVEFEAIDNASDVINNIGGALETLSSRAVQEQLKDLKLAGSDTFKAIGAAAGDLSKIAAEDELVSMRLKAQLKALGETASVTEKDIIGLAEQLSEISGFDDEALIEGQTTLLRFGTLSQDQFKKATKAAADLAAMTGMDLRSAFQQVGIALDNPEAGFGRLKRQIGDMTDEQKEAIKTALEMGDTAKAQGIILDALSGKVDGAAEAYGETFQGKVDKAKTKVDNLKSSIGELINQNLPQWVITLGVGLQSAGSLFGPVVSGVADLSIALISLQKGGSIAAIGVGLKSAFGGVAALIAGISAPVWLLIAAIAALLIVIKTMGPEAQNTLNMLFQIFKAALERIRFELNQFGDNLVKDAKEKFGEVGGAIVQGIVDGIKAAWPILLGPLGPIVALLNLLDQAKKSLDANSPSKLWADAIGKPMAEGVQVGWSKQFGATSGAIAGSLQPGGANFSNGGGMAPVTLVYSPAVSIASRAEAETVILPFVQQAMRHYRK